MLIDHHPYRKTFFEHMFGLSGVESGQNKVSTVQAMTSADPRVYGSALPGDASAGRPAKQGAHHGQGLGQ